MDDPNEVARKVLSYVEKMPAKGKPQGKEKTIIAGMLIGGEVVAVGSGSGCVSGGKIPLNGTAVVDGHAEVVCRRGFMRYLLEEVKKWKKDSETSVLVAENGKLRLKDPLCLYVSQTPCGDCCITRDKESEPVAKRRKTEKKIETGARRVARLTSPPPINIASPPPQTVSTYIFLDNGDSTPGVTRNKPGRGQASISMSCSDKIAKWNVVGVQGTLLGSLLHPIKLQSIVIGGVFDGPSVQAALRRGSKETISVSATDQAYAFSAPEMLAGDRVMCGYSSVSWKGGQDCFVSCTGYKAGATAKAISSGRATPLLAKASFSKDFISTLPDLSLDIASSLYKDFTELSKPSYTALKGLAAAYNDPDGLQKWKDCELSKQWVKKDPVLGGFHVALP